MRFLLTLAVAAWSLVAATAQTSYFPNINVRTNATVRDLTVTSTNWSLLMPSTGLLGGTAGEAVGVIGTKPAPVQISSVAMVPLVGVGANVLKKQGKYIYIGGDSNLFIVDVSIPSSPSVKGSITSDADLAFVRGIEVIGKYVYLSSRNAKKFVVVDVSNPSNPSKIGVLTSPYYGGHEFSIQGNYAFTQSYWDDKLVVINIADPTAPTIESVVSRGGSNGAHSILVRGKYAYLTSLVETNAFTYLDIFDISNLTNVTRVGGTSGTMTAGATTGPHDLQLKGSYLFISSPDEGLHVVDVSDPTAPAEVATLAFGPYGFERSTMSTLSGERLYLTGADTTNSYPVLGVVDISNPLAPTMTTTILALEAGGRGAGLEVDGNYLYYLSFTSQVLRIIDLKNSIKVGQIAAGVGEFDKLHVDYLKAEGILHGEAGSFNNLYGEELSAKKLSIYNNVKLYDTNNATPNSRWASVGWASNPTHLTLSTVNAGTSIGTGGSIRLAPLGTNVLTVSTNGRVGIGTTSPGRMFEIYGEDPLIKLNGDPSGEARSLGLNAFGFSIFNDVDSRYELVINNSGNIGVGMSAPTSTLHVAGSIGHSIAAGSAFTLTATNEVYLVNVDAQTVTLPTAVGVNGRTYTVKAITPCTTATIATTSSQLIDGASSYSLSASNKFVRVISDNANWWVIGNN